MSGKYIFCDNILEYAEQCASPDRPPNAVPVLCGIANREFDRRGLQNQPLDDPAFDWRRWSELILAAGGPEAEDAGQQINSALIEVTPGAAAVCASYLAAATNRSLRLVETLADISEESKPPRARIIVSTLDRVDDPFLFGLLNQFVAALDTGQPWATLPRFTLVVARDIPSLSWMVAKIVVAGKSVSARETRLRHYAPGQSQSEVTELELADGTGSFRIDTLTASGLLHSYKESANVMAFTTHGSEACAQGGDGTVLCGLQLHGTKFDPLDEGVLACGLGLPCPRGPHPVPLYKMAADILMLATCNGLRFADSRYREQFNFGLAFVDGPGLAYVSSVFTSGGAELASLAFLSAMAQGCMLGEATALINAFVHCAKVESASYIAIGDPEYRACPQVANNLKLMMNSLPSRLDLGEARFVKLTIADPCLVESARHARLTISIVPEEKGTKVRGFHRVELSQSGETSVLTVFLFRFPHPLGHVRIEAADRDVVCGQVRASLDTLRRWVDMWRIVGLDSTAPDDYDDLRKGEDEIRTLMARSLALLTIDGETVADLESQIKATGEFASAAREALVEWIVPQLEGSFWLPNLHAPDHQLEQIEPTSCPTCKRAAFRRTVRHMLHETKRLIVVCPRCGICADVPFDSAIEAVAIDTANLSVAGEESAVTVWVRLKRAANLRVYPRLSTHHEKTQQPNPEHGSLPTVEAGTVRLDFVFKLPVELSPHRHYVKALVYTDDGLAFASRPFFVRLGESLSDATVGSDTSQRTGHASCG